MCQARGLHLPYSCFPPGVAQAGSPGPVKALMRSSLDPPSKLLVDGRLQGSGVSQSWARATLAPFPSCMSLCTPHTLTQASVKWAPLPCRAFMGNVRAKQPIRSLLVLPGTGLGLLSLICPHSLRSLASQGRREVDEKQPGTKQAPNLPLSFPLPHPCRAA